MPTTMLPECSQKVPEGPLKAPRTIPHGSQKGPRKLTEGYQKAVRRPQKVPVGIILSTQSILLRLQPRAGRAAGRRCARLRMACATLGVVRAGEPECTTIFLHFRQKSAIEIPQQGSSGKMCGSLLAIPCVRTMGQQAPKQTCSRSSFIFLRGWHLLLCY